MRGVVPARSSFFRLCRASRWYFLNIQPHRSHFAARGGNGGMPFISPYAFANKFLEFFDHFFGPHTIGRDMDGVNGWFQPAKFARAVAMVAFVLPP